MAIPECNTKYVKISKNLINYNKQIQNLHPGWNMNHNFYLIMLRDCSAIVCALSCPNIIIKDTFLDKLWSLPKLKKIDYISFCDGSISLR